MPDYYGGDIAGPGSTDKAPKPGLLARLLAKVSKLFKK